MTDQGLALEIVTPDGVALRDNGVDVVVLHRREPRFEVGSEIAIYPRHEAMLVWLPAAPIRYRKGDAVLGFAVGAGFAEVMDDRVVVVTSRCDPLPLLGASLLPT